MSQMILPNYVYRGSPVVIMTADSWRHRFLANFLSGKLNVVGVVSEKKRSLKFGNTPQENLLIQQHIAEREDFEKKYFGKELNFDLPVDRVLKVDYGTSNSCQVFDWVNALKPELVILFGTDVIRDPLLRRYENRMVNMHLGLSPYYRGSGTSFWPLVEGEPECLGVTVHLAIDKVDAGAIFGQARPPMDAGDTMHDIGSKNILVGADLLWKCVVGYLAGELAPRPQLVGVGKLFKHRDFNAEAVTKMKTNFANNMIGDYLSNKSFRDRKYPILELPPKTIVSVCRQAPR